MTLHLQALRIQAAPTDVREADEIDSDLPGEAAASAGFMLSIEFDNQRDPEHTVITVSGQDQTDLLSQITGAFNSMDLVVASANIATTESGQVLDVFRVTDAHEKASDPLLLSRFQNCIILCWSSM